MAAHLSHKIRWDLLADYLYVYTDHGVCLPVGECGRIHAKKKKHAIQIEMRKYIPQDMICTAEDCKTTGERTFRKNEKRKLAAKGPRDLRKLEMFMESFYSAVHEFAETELKSPVKPVEYDVTVGEVFLSHCDACEKFIRLLEFGDKQKLFEYSDSELNTVLSCRSRNPGIGNHLDFLLIYILRFYIYSNVIVHLDLKEDQWPGFMKPNSYRRQDLLYPCDGQTFLPHSRHLLANAMIDLDETRLLSKRLFRFIYFYVMMRLRLDRSYKLKDHFDYLYFNIRIC